MDILVLDSSLSRALAKNDKDIIIEFLSLKLFKNIKVIFCPYLFQKSKWVLVGVSLIKRTVTALDTKPFKCFAELHEVCKNVATNREILILEDDALKFIIQFSVGET